MNKKKAIAESIEIFKLRINQLTEELKGQNLSTEQRVTLESEKRLASEDMTKLENKKAEQ